MHSSRETKILPKYLQILSNTQYPAFNLVSYNVVEQTLMHKQGARLVVEQNIKSKPKQTLLKNLKMDNLDTYILRMGNIQNMLFQKREVIATGKNSQVAYETDFIILKLTLKYSGPTKELSKRPQEPSHSETKWQNS